MVLVIYCLAVLLFCAGFYLTHLLATCHQIIAIAKTSVKTLADKSLGDDVKEMAAQAAAIAMLKSGFILVLKIAITFGVTLLPLWLGDITDLASFAETSEFSLRIDVLVITTVTVTAIVMLWRKLFSQR